MAKVLAIKIRDLLNYDREYVRDSIRTNINVLFEDNKVVYMTFKEIILQRYLLDVNNKIPSMPIVSKYAMCNFYTAGHYTSRTFNDYFEVVMRDMVDFLFRKEGRKSQPEVFKEMWYTINRIYNEYVYEVLDNASSINILDFLEIQFKPNLIKAMQDVQLKLDSSSVQITYEVLDDILRNDPLLKNNVIAKGYIAGTISANQIKQMLASRGFVTEIDSKIFKYPIASSFVLGMVDIYDLSIESRSGAKALFLSNKAVQSSEYFARELQLVTMIVEELTDGDCGNNHYIDWFVKPKEITGKGDFKNLLGKKFINPVTNQVDIIDYQHQELIEGKTIKIRSVLHCKNDNPKTICTSCFGDLSYSMHEHTNIGHYCSTEVTEKLTQSILSTKHLTSSATTNGLQLHGDAQEFFRVKNKNSYVFKNGILKTTKNKTNFKLVISQKAAFGLKDLIAGIDVYKLNPTNITLIDIMYIVVTIDGKDQWYQINVEDTNKLGSFTYEFLEYVIKEGYTLDDNDNLVINLNNWESNDAILTMPELEYNFLALANQIKSAFKYMATIKNGTALETPESLLQNVFHIVNTKLDVNLAILEVIVYAFTVYNVVDEDGKGINLNKNYNLGRNVKDQRLMRIEDIITNRSLGAGYAWERVVNNILSPKSFYGKNSVSHPLDVLVKPNEVMKEFYGQ